MHLSGCVVRLNLAGKYKQAGVNTVGLKVLCAPK